MNPRQLHCTLLTLLCLLVGGSQALGQVVINEVLVINESAIRNSVGYESYIELYNPSLEVVSLAGWSLTDSLSNPVKFVFPAEATIAPYGYVLVWCDRELAEPGFHADFKLKNTTDDIALFKDITNWVDHVPYGPQVPDLSINRFPDGTNSWQLGVPTPLSANLRITLGNPFALRINEWMADSSTDPDWLELYNPPTNVPVLLSGLIISDQDAAKAALTRPIPQLSFIASGGFVRFWANDCSVFQNCDADELGFKLGRSGDSISLYTGGATALIDRVVFGPQVTDVSMGRRPDGSTNFTTFPAGSSSPKFSNMLPLTNIVINELLAHTDPPLQDAVEFRNPTAVPVNIGNFWLSNDPNEPQKYRIPPNTFIPPFGFRVFYEYTSFNRNRTAMFPEFTFSAANGGQVVLCSGDNAGNLTGFRTLAAFGPSRNGVSFGRHVNSVGATDFVPMPVLSFGTPIRADSPPTPENISIFQGGQGATNPYPVAGPIVINEIMYHPEDFLVETNLVVNSADEFIELHNVSNNVALLFDPLYPANTWRLRGAVDFDFPPGTVIPADGYLAVVRFDPVNDPLALTNFCSRYRVSPNSQIVGPYSGKLANDSDTIELRRPDIPNATEIPYVLVERVDYLASDPWPKMPSHGGLSLQRASLTAYANDPANWFAAVPSLLRDKPDLCINEILVDADPPHESAIELFNDSAAPVDIGNWWLSNDPSAVKKYRIPPHTILEPFEFKVFYERDFNPEGTGIAPGFALNSARSNAVILISADANGNLTGYWLTESFGPTEYGVPLGRHVRSDGRSVFVPMSAPSLGAPNPEPKIGPIVISEIMYSPADLVTYSNGNQVLVNNTEDEYIELQNITSEPAALYSLAANQFTNTWQLRNEASFVFPLNLSLPPYGRVLVVNFDPLSNPSRHIQFRSKFQVPSNVRLLGPFGGRLNDRSGTIELYKPGPVQMPPEPDAGRVPYILVEKVTYEDRAPWPENTDATGASLHRRGLIDFGNDPANWRGASPSAGAGDGVEITLQPIDTVTIENYPVTLTAEATGDGVLGWQWYFIGGPSSASPIAIDGANSPALELEWPQPQNQGSYYAVVSNAFGTSTSRVATLTVLVPATIAVHPQSQVIGAGEPLTLGVAVDGSPPFGYRWRRNSITIVPFGQGMDTFAIARASLSNAGLYTVIVTNAARPSGVVSQPAYVTVVQPPVNRMVLTGTDVTLAATVAGPGAHEYQWQYEGSTVEGATAASLMIENVQVNQSGTYTIMVSNPVGAVNSFSCTLTAQETATPPQITTQPSNTAAIIGDGAALSVEAVGTEPLGYQWWFNETNVLIGSTDTSLILTNLQVVDAGAYQVVVTNVAGAITSAVAQLAVTPPDRDGDGLPDDWELAHGLNPDAPDDAEMDTDQDGLTNVREYQAGTNPTNAASVLKLEAPKVVSSHDGIVLQFMTVSNRSYVIEYRDQPDTGQWQELIAVEPGLSNRTVAVTNVLGSDPQRYYRLGTPKP